MANWFRKKNNAGEQEDFVLYNSNAGLIEEQEEDSDADTTCDLDEIQEKVKEELGESANDVLDEAKEEQSEANEEPNTEALVVSEYEIATAKKSFSEKVVDFVKSHKTLMLFTGICAAAVVVLCLLVILIAILLNPYRGYVQAEVQKGNVIPSITTSGVMAENDKYLITSLVAGKVVESVPALGDVVEEGDVLYE